MKRWINNSRNSMAVFGAAAFMLVAGWQFGVGGTEVPFSENEVALEKAIEGSGGAGTICYTTYNSCLFWNCSYIYRCKPYGPCEDQRADSWWDPGTC